MKFKSSQMLLIAMVLFLPASFILIKKYEIYGLIGWIGLMIVLGLAASKCRSEEIKLERASK